QLVLAVLLLKFPLASQALLLLNRAALALQEAIDRGTAFVFGYLGGGALPFVETPPGASFILAFKVLPLVPFTPPPSPPPLAFRPPLLLGRAAGSDPRFCLGIAAQHGAIRSARDRRRRPHLCRHDRGAAFDPALSRPHAARRALRGDELRHGGRRRHRDGGVR